MGQSTTKEKIKDILLKVFITIAGVLSAIIALFLIGKRDKPIVLQPEVNVKEEKAKIDAVAKEKEKDILEKAEQQKQDIKEKTPEDVKQELAPEVKSKIDEVKKEAVSDIMAEIEKASVKENQNG